jgi:hypothetical protein
MLKLSADATEFTFENASATQKGAGMTPFTISGKRQGLTLVHFSAQLEPRLTQETTFNTLNTP